MDNLEETVPCYFCKTFVTPLSYNGNIYKIDCFNCKVRSHVFITNNGQDLITAKRDCCKYEIVYNRKRNSTRIRKSIDIDSFFDEGDSIYLEFDTLFKFKGIKELFYLTDKEILDKINALILIK